MKFYYLNTSETSPYRNLATEYSLMKSISGNMVILFLWQNKKTIVVGRNQDVYSECKVDEFIEDGGRIARRLSGGGAVYHDRGNLNYSIICHTELEQYCKYYELLKNAFALFNIDATYNDRNDLTVEGRKVSGNAVYKSGDVVCQHGTILVASDIEKMTYYLTPDISKLNRNHVQSVKSRVENINVFNPNIGVNEVKDALIRTVDAEFLTSNPDKKMIKEMTNLFKSKKWIFGGKR